MRDLPNSVAVVGLGVSGVAVARYVMAHRTPEAPIDLAMFDGADDARLRSVAEEFSGDGLRVVLGAEALDGRYDVAVVSPGIPPASPLRRSVSSAADRVIGDIEFAFERSGSPWLAVTGTNGKTTVTSLCTHILTTAGVPAESVGNIGEPPIALVDEIGPSTALVAEVSSFQLALTETFRPRVAVLLNITPDHIDWHGSLEAYAADKTRLFANMGPGDCAVIDVDDPGSAPYAESVEARGVRVLRVSRVSVPACGAGIADGRLVLDTASGVVDLLAASDLRILGDHNRSNALAAAAAAHAWGVDAASIAEGLATFEPIEHRLEPVGTVGGVSYVNDSKATNPAASVMALTAFPATPVVLLLGGRNKDNEFDELAARAAGSVRAVVVFGEAAPEIEAAVAAAGLEHVVVRHMADAVEQASRMARPGDAVLLSPACASFDEFEGYAHRGRAFRHLVARMAQGQTS